MSSLKEPVRCYAFKLITVESLCKCDCKTEIKLDWKQSEWAGSYNKHRGSMWEVEVKFLDHQYVSFNFQIQIFKSFSSANGMIDITGQEGKRCAGFFILGADF